MTESKSRWDVRSWKRSGTWNTSLNLKSIFLLSIRINTPRTNQLQYYCTKLKLLIMSPALAHNANSSPHFLLFLKTMLSCTRCCISCVFFNISWCKAIKFMGGQDTSTTNSFQRILNSNLQVSMMFQPFLQRVEIWQERTREVERHETLGVGLCSWSISMIVALLLSCEIFSVGLNDIKWQATNYSRNSMYIEYAFDATLLSKLNSVLVQSKGKLSCNH